MPKMNFIFGHQIKPAVRMTQRSKFKNEDAQQYLVSKAAIGILATNTMRLMGWEMIPKGKGISVNVFMRIPKADAARGQDLDNLTKTILDGMNDIVYPDDSMIDAINVIRVWVDNETERQTNVGVTWNE